MTTYFADTSALAKRYITETGSAWLKAEVEPVSGNTIIIAELTLVEMFSVFTRKQREGRIAVGDLALLQNSFLLHTKTEYLVVPVDTRILLLARQLVSRYVLRTLDAIQLACASDAVAMLREPTTFLSSDTNLLVAATSEGFATNNPEQHP